MIIRIPFMNITNHIRKGKTNNEQDFNDCKRDFFIRKKTIENSNPKIFNSRTISKLNEYDSAYIVVLLEQWKTSLDYAKDISTRRMSMNGLFMTGLSLLVSGVLFGDSINFLSYSQYSIISISICIAGIILCRLWVKQLDYYRTLIAVKYDAIRETEKYLPALIANYEDVFFYNCTEATVSFSKDEKRIPMLFGVIFLILLVVLFVPFLKETLTALT